MSRVPVAVRLASHTTDELCSLIERGMSRARIAAKWGCTRRHIQLWIEGDSIRGERERQARQAAGENAVDRAEAVLLKIPNNGTIAEVARARELAQHYRWLASKLNPNYADRLTVARKVEIDPGLLTDSQLAAIAASGGQVIDGQAEDVTGPGGQVPALIDQHTRTSISPERNEKHGSGRVAGHRGSH